MINQLTCLIRLIWLQLHVTHFDTLILNDVQEKWLGTLTSVPNKGKKVPRHAPACLIGCAACDCLLHLFRRISRILWPFPDLIAHWFSFVLLLSSFAFDSCDRLSWFNQLLSCTLNLRALFFLSVMQMSVISGTHWSLWVMNGARAEKTSLTL